MKELIRFLIVCLLVVAQSASATEVKGLFSAEVIVHSQSREDRNLALREAFVIVLNRIVASQGLMLNPGVRDALKNAASYADQFQYVFMTNNLGDITQRTMKVSFNEDAVRELMHKSGLSVWNEQRGEVLVWVVLEQRGRQVLFDAEQHAEFYKALQSASQLKGIPVLLPLMDLEERQTVSAGDIVSANSDHIMIASSRYDVPAVLSGKVTKQKSCWQSEWVLNFNNKQEKWVVPCENLTANLSTAFQRVYEYLSVYDAQKPMMQEN